MTFKVKDMGDLQDLGYELERTISHAIATGHYNNLGRDVAGIAGKAISSVEDGIKDAFSGNKTTENDSFDFDSPAGTMKDVKGRNYRNADITEDDSWQNTKTASYINRINKEHRENRNKIREYKNTFEPALYDRTSMRKVGSIISMAIGYPLGFALSVVFGLAGLANPWLFFLMMIPAAFFGLGISGTVNLMKLTRFDKYISALAGKTYGDIKQLASSVGKSEKFTLKDLKKMIGDGLFRQGHIDESQTTLITSDESYEQYMLVEKNRKEQQAKEELEQSVWTEEQREIFKAGEEYINEIHRCNDEIPGEVISQKIERMEKSVRTILDEAKKKPKLVNDMRRLMNYYLPTTVKLLNAYADLDSQEKTSENIEKSKKEIEDTIDTLNDAFDRLFDDMFEDTSLDISTDAEVMKTLLEQEGLTGHSFR
ncbi:MAG: 5-bromo-4-chloroindolyl phosphate hydrolysis family protein [Lachnospiraceae bacterium]|nr:5-bromo-4-chloroindolyl phosphate hydrolysis family protein [Lachnospiraceae bacterium]